MSVGDPDNLAESEMQPGAVWEYVQGDFDTLPDFAHLAPNATGLSENVSIDGESEISLFQQSANFRPDDTQALGDFGVRFSGFLKIPQDGTW